MCGWNTNIYKIQNQQQTWTVWRLWLQDIDLSLASNWLLLIFQIPSIMYYVTCVIITSRLVDNLVLFQITVIMNMSGVEECEGECWAGWDTWDYWSSVWIEGVILPAIAALGIAGRRRKKLHCNLFVVREDHSALMFIHCLVLSASSSLKRRIEQIKFRRIYWIKSRKINNWWWLSSSINLSLSQSDDSYFWVAGSEKEDF